VVEAGLRFRQPARYDDLVAVGPRVGDLRRVRFRLDHVLRRQSSGEVLCTRHIWLASVTREGRTVAVPGDLRQRLSSLLEDGGKTG